MNLSSTTALQQAVTNIDWLSPILSGLVAAVIALLGQWYFFERNENMERKKKLYGPLRFNLLMMQLIFRNQKEVINDIKQFHHTEMQGKSMIEHLSPLTQRWLWHRDNIKKLFTEYPGLIDSDDFSLMSDFIDGCLKREIIEEGKNFLALNQERTEKLLNAVSNLQKKLL